jgi:hypothetical protein
MASATVHHCEGAGPTVGRGHRGLQPAVVHVGYYQDYSAI